MEGLITDNFITGLEFTLAREKNEEDISNIGIGRVF